MEVRICLGCRGCLVEYSSFETVEIVFSMGGGKFAGPTLGRGFGPRSFFFLLFLCCAALHIRSLVFSAV